MRTCPWVTPTAGVHTITDPNRWLVNYAKSKDLGNIFTFYFCSFTNLILRRYGHYHLFYQYSRNDTKWDDIVWAHAIFPSKPFDREGCWSGSATIIPGEGPVIFYTGLDINKTQVQNIAYPENVSDPYLRGWNKPDFNPVIFPDAGIDASSFRDPTTAWVGQDGAWRIVVGSQRGNRGLAVLYRSKDFRTWVQAKHPLLHSVVDEGMWECPGFFPASMKSGGGNGTKHVLKISLTEDTMIIF